MQGACCVCVRVYVLWTFSYSEREREGIVCVCVCVCLWACLSLGGREWDVFLQAILSFCEAPGARSEELSLYFHKRGMPILFTTEGVCVRVCV
ncbi:MAG: hypothetical protein P4L40_03295 [Terracidiphilus sp.]|nr:hypothetical protein [Terracidiphilus sp.]